MQQETLAKREYEQRILREQDEQKEALATAALQKDSDFAAETAKYDEELGLSAEVEEKEKAIERAKMGLDKLEKGAPATSTSSSDSGAPASQVTVMSAPAKKRITSEEELDDER